MFPHALTIEDEMLQGWVMIGSLSFVFTLNLMVMLITSIMNLKRKLRLRKLKIIYDRRVKFLQERAKDKLDGLDKLPSK